MKKLLLIAGTRPNFIKLAPLYHRLQKAANYKIYICHTGQHFDFNMSDIFWRLLKLPEPDFMLDCSGSSSSEIIGKTILSLNMVFQKNEFDLVIVFGDVNATAAGSIVSSHRRKKLMHVEAGLRSFDRDMPEEINRIISDHVADFLIVSEESGLVNLKNEGIEKSKVFFAGNIMIESLIRTEPDWTKINIDDYSKAQHIVATFHRPENVDNRENLLSIDRLLKNLAKSYTVLFPVHPRTEKKLREFNLWEDLKNTNNIILSAPMDYFQFLKLVSKASCVITDSGGVQEETTYLQVPCVTLRKNTERPVTVSNGTNLLCNVNDDNLSSKIEQHIKLLKSKTLHGIPFWDDKVSERIVQIIDENI